MIGLPTNVLVEVFLYLDMRERVKLERVSTAWRDIMPYYDNQDIDLTSILFPRKKHQKITDTLTFHQDLISIFSRTGKYLEKLQFGNGCNIRISATIVELLDEYCSNLQFLDMSFCDFSGVPIDCLVPIADRLISLSFGNSHFKADAEVLLDQMSTLFRSVPVLERLDIQGTRIYNMSVIRFLPKSLKSINLNNCDSLGQETMLAFLSGCSTLKELHLAGFMGLNDIIFDMICSLDKLEILELSHLATLEMIWRQDSGRLDYSKLEKLINLKELYVQYSNGITGNALERIVKGCPSLHALNVSYCRNIVNFQALFHTNNLTILKVAASDIFDDKVLQAVSQANRNLQIIHACSCEIMDAGLEVLVQTNASTLREISISRSKCVTDSSISKILASCPRLTLLDAQDSSASNVSVLAIAECIPLWKNKRIRINLSYCSEITDQGLDHINKALHTCPDFFGTISLRLHQTKVSKTFDATLNQPRLCVEL